MNQSVDVDAVAWLFHNRGSAKPFLDFQGKQAGTAGSREKYSGGSQHEVCVILISYDSILDHL